MVQTAMKVSKKSFIPQMVNNIVEASPAFWLKSDGQSLISTSEKPIIFELPKSVTSTKQACEYMHYERRLPFHTRLASIGANDSIIAFQGSHSIMDGGNALDLIAKSINKINYQRPPFPMCMEDIHHDLLAENEDYESILKDRDLVTTLTPKARETTNPCFDMCRYIPMVIDAAKLKCYDKAQKRPVNFNPAVSAAISISASALNGRIDHMGSCTCVDLRQKTKREFLPYCGNNFGEIFLTNPGFSPKKTVGDLMKAFREKLNHAKK